MFYCIGTADLVPETAVAINIRLLNHSTIPQSALLPEFSLNHSVSQAVLSPAAIRHPSERCIGAESVHSRHHRKRSLFAGNKRHAADRRAPTRIVVALSSERSRMSSVIIGLLKSLAFSGAQPRNRPLMERCKPDEGSTRRRTHDAIRRAQRNDRLFCQGMLDC